MRFYEKLVKNSDYISFWLLNRNILTLSLQVKHRLLISKKRIFSIVSCFFEDKVKFYQIIVAQNCPLFASKNYGESLKMIAFNTALITHNQTKPTLFLESVISCETFTKYSKHKCAFVLQAATTAMIKTGFFKNSLIFFTKYVISFQQR